MRQWWTRAGVPSCEDGQNECADGQMMSPRTGFLPAEPGPEQAWVVKGLHRLELSESCDHNAGFHAPQGIAACRSIRASSRQAGPEVLMGAAAAHACQRVLAWSPAALLYSSGADKGLRRRHPATYPELELSHLVQSAALLGIGLVYQESCHRRACPEHMWW